MSGKLPIPLQSELTEAGEQTLVSGVRPVTLCDQLAVMANRLLRHGLQLFYLIELFWRRDNCPTC